MGRVKWDEAVKLDSEVVIVQGSKTEDIEEWIEFHAHRFRKEWIVHTVTVTKSKDENGENSYIGTIVFHRKEKGDGLN